ncbi:hypothetical protein IWW57_000396, partial [Coemansia sp. S610]
ISQSSLSLDERRAKLANALEGLESKILITALFDKLGLRSAFKAYESAVGDMFSLKSKDFRAILGKALVTGEAPPEKAYVRQLLSVVQFMDVCAKRKSSKQKPQMVYNARDCQDVSPDDTKLRPDVVFSFPTIGTATFREAYLFLEGKKHRSGSDIASKVLTQLADYVLALWECQPTRTFVPILFLHKSELDLFVFTRKGYFRASIGTVLLTEHCDREIMSTRISQSLQHLWFLLTLPANRFGFLFNSPAIPVNLKIDTSAIPTTVEETGNLGDDSVHVEAPIARPVSIVGRCSYLFNAKYGGESAVLKLTWTRTGRLPEGAVYRVLEHHGVSNIPKIFKSGVIVKDFAGYRLEFLVMEHCGTPMVTHVQGMSMGYMSMFLVDKLVKSSIVCVSTTLTEALAANVLHRDVSADSITIKDGTAHVICWGYAKLISPPSDLDLRAETAKYWCFDWDKALKPTPAKDQSIGPALYVSSRLLLQAATRGIYDDLESLLYVTLDTLSNRLRAGKPNEQPVGFAFLNSPSMAMARLACTQSDSRFLSFFGVDLLRISTLEDVLNAMRRFLFCDDGSHLLSRILDGRDFPRKFDRRAARLFMSDKTASELLRLAGRTQNQSPMRVEAVTILTTAPNVQRSVRAARPAQFPPPPPLVHSPKQGFLGSNDDAGMANTATRNSKSGPVTDRLVSPSPGVRYSRASFGPGSMSGSPSPSCGGARSSQMPFGYGVRSLRSSSQRMTLPPARNKLHPASSAGPPRTNPRKSMANAAPLKVPIYSTPMQTGPVAASIAKKGTTQARPTKILGSISGYSSKAISGISTNIKMIQFAKPMAPVPKIKEGNSKATASNTRGLGKENVKTVRKPIAISRSSSLDVYKRVSGGKSKTNSQQPAKRAKK